MSNNLSFLLKKFIFLFPDCQKNKVAVIFDCMGKLVLNYLLREKENSQLTTPTTIAGSKTGVARHLTDESRTKKQN